MADALFPLLPENCAILELLIMYNGLGISCHSTINHLHNVPITVSMYVYTAAGREFSPFQTLDFQSSTIRELPHA